MSLELATFSGSWSFQTIDSADVSRPAITLDRSGNALITYQDLAHLDLVFAKPAGNSWSKVVLDSSGSAGFVSSLTVDGARRTFILYAASSPDETSDGRLGILSTQYQINESSYHEYDTDIDMRTVFWDSSRVPNPRSLQLLYSSPTDNGPGSSAIPGTLAYINGAYPSPLSASKTIFGYDYFFTPVPGHSHFLSGANFPWMLDDRIPAGNFRGRSYTSIASASLDPPPGWYTKTLSPISGHPLDSSTFALWRLDGNGNDLGPNNFTLTASQGTNWVPAQIGQGWQSFGSYTLDAQANTPSVNLFASGSYTTEMWVKRTAIHGAGVLFILNGLNFTVSGSDVNLGEIGLTDLGNLYWKSWIDTTNYVEVTSSTNIVINKFSHVALTRQPDGLGTYNYQLYVNGAPDAAGTVSHVSGVANPTLLSGSTHYWSIGCYTGQFGPAFPGGGQPSAIIDDVRVSSIVRSPSEIFTDYLMGASGTIGPGAGEFPTYGMQIGPENIQPVYPLLDDVYVEKIYDEIPAVSGAVVVPQNRSKIIGFRPGLRGTEVNGKWQLLIGVASDFDAVSGSLANNRSGIWFRQFRLEFLIDQGQDTTPFYPSKGRRFNKTTYVPQREGKRRVGILSGSASWDIGVNYIYVQQNPEYGRSVGITDHTGSATDSFAVYTKVTGALADVLGESAGFLQNEFGTPYVPISSGSSLPPSFQTFSADDIQRSRLIFDQVLNPKPIVPVANDIRSVLSRLGELKTTRQKMLDALSEFDSSSSGSI